MKHLKALLLGVVFLGVYPIYGQQIVVGAVLDEGGNPLSFASVLLLEARDSTFVKGAITNEDGRFVFQNIESGEFILSSSSVGYRQAYRTISVAKTVSEQVLEAFILEQESVTLEELEIKARKPLFQQEIDRLIVNVAQTVNFAGNTALEILEKSPWVVVNRQNESFTMAGKNGVLVMINGKLSRMPMSALFQMLGGMPSSNIEKIELITNPPASFDAEGDAGFINVVLKKNEEEGTNGSYTMSFGYGVGEKIRPGFNFNHRQGKVNVYGDYSYNRNVTEMLISTDRVIQFGAESRSTNTVAFRDPQVDLHTGQLGIDVELSPKTVVGSLISILDRDWHQETANEAIYLGTESGRSSMEGQRKDRNKSHQYLFNLNISHQFSLRQRLNVDLDYFNFQTSQPQTYANLYFDANNKIERREAIRVAKNTPLNIWVAKVDYAIHLGDQIKLETGLKTTFSDFTNQVLVEFNDGSGWLKRQDFSEDAGFQEDINAAYGLISYEIDPKTTLQAGLRFEYTNTKLESETEENSLFRSYGNFFPSLFISRKLENEKSLQLAYSRRITRPTFNQLAPFVIFLEPNTFITGNSFLFPALTDQLKLDFKIKAVIISTQYSLDQNAIATFQPKVVAENNLITYSAENLKQRKTLSLSLSFPVLVSRWWEMQNQFLAIRGQLSTDYQEVPVQLFQNSLILSTNHTFTIPRDYFIELSAFYNSQALDGLSRQRAFGAVNIGLQKRFKNKGGTLSMNISDLFKTRQIVMDTRIQELNLHNTFNMDLEFRVFTISYTRSLGSQKVEKFRERKTGSEEERSRL